MGQQYKIAVFDLDGTLLDTSEGIISSVKYTIDKFGLDRLSENKIKSFIGPPIQNSFSNIYGIEGDLLQEIATVFRNRYKTEDLLKAKPYEGIYDVFQRLLDIGVKPAIATYKRQDYATTILDYFGFSQYTNIICGADHENKLKKKDIIKNVLISSGVNNYRHAVMIGDSDNDAIGAQEIGIDFIGVTYGFGFKDILDVKKFPNVGSACNTKELIGLLAGGRLDANKSGKIYI